ncbi:HD-GYP domain-containing protein [Neomoorella humiferrea]|uniref:Cyclic di-GMP phosphodiesterase response regulator RpfG n=1 Tax=Neomoorella humiferrea TaxID=676965 RepID=A0A2T0AS52_9FIRM|nr:HD-GYP domain-containing protein [Moorella humiferrea]PRR72898.1 Cyclic di-GMP phosphodiesterase response regulator RpfG [Moorella humiferrea]
MGCGAERTFCELIVALSNILDVEENTKLYHAWRVALVAGEMARKVLPEQANLVFYAGLLHDIGGMGLDDHLVHIILKGDGGKNPEVRAHPQKGADIVAAIPGLGEEAATMVRQHHERYDGSGYPAGLKGKAIDPGALLLGLADEFDLVLRVLPGRPWSTVKETLQRRIGGAIPAELVTVLDKVMSGGLFDEVATLPALELKMFHTILNLPPVNFNINEPMMITINLFAQIIDAKHTYTAGHSRRVASYAMKLGRCLGMDDEGIQRLEIAGLLHDFGKIAVPRAILDKPGRLDEREWEIVQQHPGRTIELLNGVTSLKSLARDAGLHHERYDGKGYPYGLKGTEIPLGARIIAVADAFDAMTSRRPYQPTRTFEEALAMLAKGSGIQFDPAVVAVADCLLHN